MGNITYTIRPMYKYMVTEILLCGLGSLVSERHLLFSKAELREHHALYTLHKIPKDRATPSGPTNMIT